MSKALLQLNYARPMKHRSTPQRAMVVLTRIVGPIFCWMLLMLYVLITYTFLYQWQLFWK